MLILDRLAGRGQSWLRGCGLLALIRCGRLALILSFGNLTALFKHLLHIYYPFSSAFVRIDLRVGYDS